MRNDAAATNDRPYKLVMPKKAALAAAGVLVSYTLATKTQTRDSSTRRAEALWKRYGGVAGNARGPEFCKAWKPLRSTSTHCERRNAARTLPQERHRQQPSVNAQKAATMSSWMKTLQSGANKVGTAPRSNQTPPPWTRRCSHRQRGREAQALRRDLSAQGRHQEPQGGVGRDLF